MEQTQQHGQWGQYYQLLNHKTMTIRFKLQGDGRKSWVIDEKEIVYKSPINKIHNERLAEVLKQYDYESLAEVLIWVDDVDYGDEAKAILDWWKSTCKDIIGYKKGKPNEENVGAFIETLTIFEAPIKPKKIK